jgi:hypothetical protein
LGESVASQVDDLLQNPIADVGFQPGFHDEIDFEIEGFAEIVFEFAEFDEAKPGFGGEFDQNIEVTGGRLFTSDVGAEDADLGDLVGLLEEGLDLAEVGLDVVERSHGGWGSPRCDNGTTDILLQLTFGLIFSLPIEVVAPNLVVTSH